MIKTGRMTGFIFMTFYFQSAFAFVLELNNLFRILLIYLVFVLY